MVGYNTVLKLSDFADPAFGGTMAETFSAMAAVHPNFPVGAELAKAWEVTQAVRGLRDHGALHPQAELLGVGAGFEHTVFYLTNFARRVFATDLYATNDQWKEAEAGMMVDPAPFAPPETPHNLNRLVVQHMDALALRYEDNSFDGVFSCGSIEHFGSLENVAQAAREMGRVLKPGGIMVLSTEFRISGPDGLGIHGAILFDRAMVERYIIEASGLVPVDRMETATSQETLDLAYPLLTAIHEGVRAPSIALTHDGYTWVSIALCLRKE
jgi:SAM-dependent methyltransferase